MMKQNCDGPYFSFRHIKRAVLSQPMTGGVYVTTRELFSEHHHTALVDARMLIVKLCLRYTRNAYFTKIGHFINRDHSNVIFLINRFKTHPHYHVMLQEAERYLLANGTPLVIVKELA